MVDWLFTAQDGERMSHWGQPACEDEVKRMLSEKVNRERNESGNDVRRAKWVGKWCEGERNESGNDVKENEMNRDMMWGRTIRPFLGLDAEFIFPLALALTEKDNLFLYEILSYSWGFRHKVWRSGGNERTSNEIYAVFPQAIPLSPKL